MEMLDWVMEVAVVKGHRRRFRVERYSMYWAIRIGYTGIGSGTYRELQNNRQHMLLPNTCIRL